MLLHQKKLVKKHLATLCRLYFLFYLKVETLYMKNKLTVVLLVWGLCAQSQTAAPYQVVINEMMADPTPPVGLPNAEFIELRNVSNRAFNLNGWRIGDAGGFAGIAVNFVLQPDSFVIICASNAAASFAGFGAVIGVGNFPSLDNDNDELYLRSKEGVTIHAVAYNAAWYQNVVKNQGGWSLEMVDAGNPCSGFSNWSASIDPKGGSPGRKNSVDAVNTDLQPPVLLDAFAADSVTIILRFDEPLDSAKAVVTGNYSISDGAGNPQQVSVQPPVFDKVQLRANTALVKNKVYNITVRNITDCSGNAVGAYNHAKLGRAAVADTFDLVINEILFNPAPDGADYVELYNRGNAIIDLKESYIATRSSAGVISTPKQINAFNRLLFPGEYLVVTDDESAVKKQYLAKAPLAFAMITSMPSLPDDKGDVLILNAQGRILDELSYDAHWHFKLIDNDEGVALERIDYNKPTQDAGNWHSAATSAGYGTPGYQNSQFMQDVLGTGDISFNPAVFSPDNDGLDDFLTISYQFPDPGYVCNITVFDAAGRPVQYIARNALCGLKGSFRWDGLDQHNSKLPVGVYVVVTEVFNLQGKTKRFKQAVTLARRF
jgi:hypothetical protein